MPKMSLGWSRGLQVVLSIGILLAGFGGMYTLASRRVRPEPVGHAPVAPLVNAVVVEPHSGTLDITVDGIVTPYRDIAIAAEVGGRVVRKTEHCRAGHFVTKGELLFQIDAQDYELEVRQLEKQVEQAQANLQVLDVELSNTEAMLESGKEELALHQTELNRLQGLRGGAVADSQVDEARRAEWASRHGLLSLRNQALLIQSRRRGLENALDLARSQLAKARLDLARTTIVAPMAGVIVRDLVEQDSYVQKGDELLTIEDTSRAEVKCNLQMAELAWIWRQRSATTSASVPGTSVPAGRAELAGEPGARLQGGEQADLYELPPTPATVIFQPLGSEVRFEWKAVLSRFDGAGIDGRTRMVPCRLTVTDPRSAPDGNGSAPGPRGPLALLRGMYVTVIIHAQSDANFLRVPEVAVQPGKKLLRIRNDRIEILGPMHLVQLVTIGTDAGQPLKVWLLDAAGTDLRAGDQVTTSPVPSAYTGMSVRRLARATTSAPSG